MSPKKAGLSSSVPTLPSIKTKEVINYPRKSKKSAFRRHSEYTLNKLLSGIRLCHFPQLAPLIRKKVTPTNMERPILGHLPRLNFSNSEGDILNAQTRPINAFPTQVKTKFRRATSDETSYRSSLETATIKEETTEENGSTCQASDLPESYASMKSNSITSGTPAWETNNYFSSKNYNDESNPGVMKQFNVRRLREIAELGQRNESRRSDSSGDADIDFEANTSKRMEGRRMFLR